MQRKIIITLLLIWSCANYMQAQKFNTYLLANFKFFSPYETANTTPPFELMMVKVKSKKHGNRYGFNVIHTPYRIYSKNDYIKNDTTYSEYKNVSAILPRISLGKEWYKHLHSDVILHAGFDGIIGAMQNRVDSSFERSYKNGSITNSFNLNQHTTNYSLEARPFLGLRTTWGPLIIGYQASIPFQILNQEFTGLELDLLHQLSLGYAFNRKKLKVKKVQ